jgi:hypothetical protein
MSCTDLLLPRDVLKPRAPDEHFAPEAQAARDAGIDVHLVDHDAVVAGEVDAALTGVAGPGEQFVYRGWMVSPSRYRDLAVALERRGIVLRTSAEQFKTSHQLPHWYSALAALTPESVWTDTADLDEFVTAAGRLGPGPAVLKDYSKSEKHYWDEAMFIPELADTDHALRVARRFVELRGSGFDTGFVIRRFEDLAPAEWRTWWIGDQCVLATAHPDSPEEAPPVDLDLVEIAAVVPVLGLPFISVDLARRADGGQLRIVEIGDGQVSDRPLTSNPSQFIAAITKA